MPYQALMDNQAQFVDQAADRMGTQSLYPLIRAVDLMTEARGEEFDWGTVDFVADRNSLRKLLSWIQGDARSKPFTIATQLAGQRTVLLNRCEAMTRQAVGHWPINFQRESTYQAPGCEHIPTVSHHRIVRYVRQSNLYVDPPSCSSSMLRTSVASIWLSASLWMHVLHLRTSTT